MIPQAWGKFLQTPIHACQAFGKTNIYLTMRAEQTILRYIYIIPFPYWFLSSIETPVPH